MPDEEYVVDTSSWIALSRKRPIEYHEVTWAKIDTMIAGGQLKSPRGVYDEISAGRDRLWEWIDARQLAFVLDTPDLLMLVGEIIDRFPQLVDESKEALDADPYVVALAVLLSRRRDRPGVEPTVTIVTEEVDRPDRPTKIPFVARRYGVPSTNMDGMLGREGI